MFLSSFPKIDLTISISVIVALCAIISPILTSIIDNRYKLKMRKLELEYDSQKSIKLHNRNIFENYLKSIGHCLHDCNHQTEGAYGESYFLALQLAPDELQKQMIAVNLLYSQDRFQEAIAELEKISTNFHMLQ